MPILKGSASFSRYRVEPDGKSPKSAKSAKIDPKELLKALQVRAFQPLARESDDERAQGFVELANKNGVDFSPGNTLEGPFALFAYRVDEVRIPSAAIKAELEVWEQKFEAENQRKAGKKEKNDAKGEIRHTLKARYPLVTKTFEVSWNLDTAHAQVWAGSRKAVDEVQGAVEQACGVKLIPVAPITIAPQLGIADKALTPTPSLSMPEEL